MLVGEEKERREEKKYHVLTREEGRKEKEMTTLAKEKREKIKGEKKLNKSVGKGGKEGKREERK